VNADKGRESDQDGQQRYNLGREKKKKVFHVVQFDLNFIKITMDRRI
jgi:hypothetical protein